MCYPRTSRTQTIVFSRFIEAIYFQAIAASASINQLLFACSLCGSFHSRPKQLGHIQRTISIVTFNESETRSQHSGGSRSLSTSDTPFSRTPSNRLNERMTEWASGDTALSAMAAKLFRTTSPSLYHRYRGLCDLLPCAWCYFCWILIVKVTAWRRVHANALLLTNKSSFIDCHDTLLQTFCLLLYTIVW